MHKRLWRIALVAGVFASGYLVGQGGPGLVSPAGAAEAARVFEIRTYTAHEGRLPNLHARFRDHTMRLFAKHGMTNVGYWTPQDGALSENTLIYILAHPSREAARASWEAFRTDPEWHRARDASEADGKIVSKLESVFIDATDYSPLK